MHIREGHPVASKNLQGESGLSVSSATVRNIMSELEDLGYLASPHRLVGFRQLGYRRLVAAG